MVTKLNVPPSPKMAFGKNYIQQAVCEIRFPTLFEFEDARPPAAFALALRKDFPNHQAAFGTQLLPTGPQRSRRHSFTTAHGDCAVTLRSASASIETASYDSFETFFRRTTIMAKALNQVADTDTFTRVGLRYINALPLDSQSIEGWVNPALVQPLLLDQLGDLFEHSGTFSGIAETGKYRLMHAVADDDGSEFRKYLIDLDFFEIDVKIDDVEKLIEKLHEQLFSLFMWSLGPKAINKLSESK